MIPRHEWTLISADNVWESWRCTTCPNHHYQRRITLKVRIIPGDDWKVSTCPRCKNYNCICVR